MELIEKGAQANIESFKQLMVKLSWNGGKDFDLGALLEYKEEGKENDFIYFSNMGDLNGPLFIQLDKDAGVGDTVDDGGNAETMKIMNLDPYRQIHLCLWDYGAIQAGGKTARFDDDMPKIEILDDKGNAHSVIIPTDIAAQLGNCVCLATLDNSSAMGVKFTNQSIIGTAKKFNDVPAWLAEVANVTG